MTVEHASEIGPAEGFAGPAGPVTNEESLKRVVGTLVLAAGTASEVLSTTQAAGLRSDPFMAATRIADGGAVGSYRCTWNEGTRTFTVTSSSGTDTSTVRYLLEQWLP